MERQEIYRWVKQKYGTDPDYPWDDWNVVLRHKNSGKWYAVILEVRRDRLGLDGDDEIDVLNVKCDPILIGALRTKEGFHPAYHMNKEQWISIRLDGSVPEQEIRNLIDMSYHLTEAKGRKKKQQKQ